MNEVGSEPRSLVPLQTTTEVEVAEEVHGGDVEVEISTEPSGASETPAPVLMETSERLPFGKDAEPSEVAAEVVETDRLARLKKFDSEWEKLEKRSPEIAELCEELLAEGSPGAAAQIGDAGRNGVLFEICKRAAELWRTDDQKIWCRARDMLIIAIQDLIWG